MKICDDVILHVICGLGLPKSQILATPICQNSRNFYIWLFSFQPIKNNAVLEPRTGHFRVLVSFEAKAKNFKMFPQGRPRNQGCPPGLHLCKTALNTGLSSLTKRWVLGIGTESFVSGRLWKLQGLRLKILKSLMKRKKVFPQNRTTFRPEIR